MWNTSTILHTLQSLYYNILLTSALANTSSRYEPNQACGKVKLSISNLLLVNKTHMNQWINQMNQSMKDQDVFRALRTQCIIIKYELRFIIGFLKFTLRKIKLRNLPFQIDGLQCMKQVVEDSNAFFPPFLKRMNC